MANSSGLPPEDVRRLTQIQVAAALKINPAKVSFIERGLTQDNGCVIQCAQWLRQRI